ncbi:hypothetical protein RR48_10811 [Papilio machaon]|uniref:Uncharacterized protein n=1 Tax=Papilio machaon TaxID=76193 RepID=A0A194R7K4_PAPMA|nr:hypothetical protein RR48_10811 [Papilio machaon]
MEQGSHEKVKISSFCAFPPPLITGIVKSYMRVECCKLVRNECGPVVYVGLVISALIVALRSTDATAFPRRRSLELGGGAANCRQLCVSPREFARGACPWVHSDCVHDNSNAELPALANTMLGFSMWGVAAVAMLLLVPQVLCAGYCATDTLRTNTTWMQFTKEPVSFEYGFQDKFKSIHCCVKGYRSIECRTLEVSICEGIARRRKPVLWRFPEGTLLRTAAFTCPPSPPPRRLQPPLLLFPASLAPLAFQSMSSALMPCNYAVRSPYF